MIPFRPAISSILILNLLLGGIIGEGPLWLCQDADGRVSVEDSDSRAACCNAHHDDGGDQGASVDGEPCCHDVLIASGRGSGEFQAAPPSILPLTLTLFFEPVLLCGVIPASPVLHADWTPLARGAPPLSHLATVILLV